MQDLNAPRADHPLINMRPQTLEEIVIKEMHLAAHHSAQRSAGSVRP